MSLLSHLDAMFTQIVHHIIRILDDKRDMVHTLTFFIEEFLPGAWPAYGFDEFDGTWPMSKRQFGLRLSRLAFIGRSAFVFGSDVISGWSSPNIRQ
jgi:hypothetical protein